MRITAVRGRTLRRSARRLMALAALGVVVGGCWSLGRNPGSPPVRPGMPNEVAAKPAPPAGVGVALPRLPNIVLITTDDQNASDLRWMPRTRRTLQRAGMLFTTALSPQPLCCPARAEVLTGQYAQNNGVRHNHGTYGGARRLDDDNTIAAWLSRRQYDTAFVGKYLNEYGKRGSRPRGWTIWNPMVSRIYSYYGTGFYDQKGSVPDPRYSVDVVSDLTVKYIQRLSATGRPFFIWSSQVAPHAAPARHHTWKAPPSAVQREVGPGAVAPSLGKPSFNVPGVIEPDLVGEQGAWRRSYIQNYFTQRIRSLRSVDIAVARTINTLARLHELDRTYVFFTSDNAYLLGEHGLVGKNVLYEEAIRVPLLVRGPAIQAASHSAVPVTLVDLFPTFAGIARPEETVDRDGQSFLPLLYGRSTAWRDTQLVQTGTERRRGLHPGWGRRGVRTSRYTFTTDVATGARALFDRQVDPYEVTNFATDPSYASVVNELASRTTDLSRCHGASCAVSFGAPPGPSKK